MVKPLINGITLTIVLTEQIEKRRRLNSGSQLPFWESSFSQEKKKSRDKWILESLFV